MGIETILYDHLERGRRPEEIQASYPTLGLEQVYAAILYYLQNKEQVQSYFDEWIEHGRRMREKQRRDNSPAAVKLRELMQRIPLHAGAPEQRP